MGSDAFQDRLSALRPRLHRYCARMTGSAILGEDLVQDTFLRALQAREQGAAVANLEGWLFRIAHNASLDLLRERRRHTVVALSEDLEAAPIPEVDVIAFSFHTFMRLPELQRCAVILKDVLGHSLEEIAGIAACSVPAAKSALQRGRAALARLAQAPADTRLPLLGDAQRRDLAAYVRRFQSGDFDAIRAQLAEEVKLELVNRLRLQGRDKISPYFTRYAEVRKWRFALGAVEGQPAMLVFDSSAAPARPAHFVLVEWSQARIVSIRDFLFAPYVLEGTDWVRLG
jgi:RNA polymerase sigma factor (sigma-70 family)